MFKMKEDEDIKTMYARPKVTAIQESKDLNDVTLENLISSLRSHEMELQQDEPVKKSCSFKGNQKSV
ncbi:aspartyl-tRNA synthetase [Trifolium pratense]|uniref:Aspartyl-tRNA synthetase n=1 Tax=Trifolium pratense TaxID=57577 RepID=A0A2K3K7Z8_TRIPR|nr:aspartyl-tRNA synthetase [Trifolium pratense]PNX62392.1 aspartyl-tRNA synthetase [Trifolium pratense]